MSGASHSSACVGCGQPLPAGQPNCLACGIAGPWQEAIRAVDFARECFVRWAKDQTIGSRPSESVVADCNQQRERMSWTARRGGPLPADLAVMLADKCWNCGAELSAADRHCAGCGVPVNRDSVQLLQYWTYTCHRIKEQCDAGRLPLVQAHACMNDAKSRIAVLRSRLEKERVEVAAEIGEKVAQAARGGRDAG